VQLVLKGVIREDEWEEMSNHIRYDFNKDNYYAELKENEILSGRLGMLQLMDPFVGKYFSKEYALDKVLRLTEDEIKQIETAIETEKDDEYLKADHDGTVAGVTQTAQQTYLQQNAPPETQEAPTSDKKQ
jgi:beta-lactamase class A